MNERALSKRLQLVATFLPNGAIFADIGSDHAYLPCYVCLHDKKARAIAGELNEGPYQSAKRTVQGQNLSDRVDVRKGDGLLVLDHNEVNQVTIAGMGGSLITHILEKGKEKLGSVTRIIAQPNVDSYDVRNWFYQNNYQLVNERIIEEDGHIYEVLVADKNIESDIYQRDELERQMLFGPYLMQEKSETFKQKWTLEKQKRERVITQMKQAKSVDLDKIKKFEEEVQIIEEVIQDV